MRVLLLGSGGREHALAAAIAASPLLDTLWIAPGNPGTAALGRNIAIAATDVAALVAFARENAVDLVVPGPEAPLVAGIADACAEAGIACCGPTAAAAALEGSKAFCKELCDAAGIPTARWEAFEEAEAARAFVRRRGAPIVVKADGPAAGKGVVVATTVEEAEAAIDAMLGERVFGDAGARVVIEEFMPGEELSVFALCDGTEAVFLGAAQDHKRVGEGDTGPNTGGMGAISPPPAADPALVAAVMEGVVRPALGELARRGTPFRGVLFAGLMLGPDSVRLVEFNVRFGDPEAEAILPRLQSDLLPALVAACDGELGHFDLRFRAEACVAVVMAARGYPGKPATGGAITLPDAGSHPGVAVFQAGTRMGKGGLIAEGGRVLVVSALGGDVAAARRAAYGVVDRVGWSEGFCRRDIGARALAFGGARETAATSG